MIVNSKFSSLYLGKKEDWKASFDKNVCYIQKFAIGEEIRVQFVGYSSDFFAKYTNEAGVDTQLSVVLLHKDPSSEKRLFEVVFSINKQGVYQFHLTNRINEAYSYFSIHKPSELSNTILLNYTHRKNDFDTIFVNQDETKKTFNLRIEGGLYPGDRTQVVENEIFRDQRFTPFQLSADTYQVSVLTIGNPAGVPQWIGNRVNNIFKLSKVLVDDMETTRNESSIPELIQIASYYPLYVFKLNIEQSDNEVINETLLRIFDFTFNNPFN